MKHRFHFYNLGQCVLEVSKMYFQGEITCEECKASCQWVSNDFSVSQVNFLPNTHLCIVSTELQWNSVREEIIISSLAWQSLWGTPNHRYHPLPSSSVRFDFCHYPVDFHAHSCTYPHSLPLTPTCVDAWISSGEWQKPHILLEKNYFISTTHFFIISNNLFLCSEISWTKQLAKVVQQYLLHLSYHVAWPCTMWVCSTDKFLTHENHL